MLYLHFDHGTAAPANYQRPPVGTHETLNQWALCLVIPLWENVSNGFAWSFNTGVVYILGMYSLGDEADLGGGKIYCPTSVSHIIFVFLFSLEIFFSTLGCNQKENNRSCG